MRYLATVLFLCSALTHAAPPDGFALVHDADGHTNLRESPDLNAKVLAKIPNGTPLDCLGDGGEGSLSFCTAQLQQPTAEDYGFIHYSRLIFPAADKSFVRLREQSGRDDTLTLSGSGQKVHIVARRIHPKLSDFSGINKDKYTARLYRGKPFYGTDYDIPKSVFALERITLNGQAVPAAELQGLFSPDFAPPHAAAMYIKAGKPITATAIRRFTCSADKVRTAILLASALYLRTANSSAVIYGVLRFKYRSKGRLKP